ncbi:AfsR/SARP family transcriptional regulator [Kribbella sp. NBC_01245]|uniref:AfsR/SARP family transcriptional regulator n=1 Tax=Kribbella sp. NBC_01245 TaxID=2903578 RepID=UPI003FA59376
MARVDWQTVRVGGLVVSCLGPLQLDRGGRPLLLTSRRSRILLVVLALSAGQTVPVERLVAAAWEDTNRPQDSRNSLHTLISRLRTRVGAELIETRPAGYRLTIDRPVRAAQPGRAVPGGGRASRGSRVQPP